MMMEINISVEFFDTESVKLVLRARFGSIDCEAEAQSIFMSGKV